MQTEQKEPQATIEDAFNVSSDQGLEDLPQVPTITVYGDFFDRVEIIQRTLMSLLLGMGRLTDDKDTSVLIPYIEMKLGGPEPEDEASFSKILTMENVAYVIAEVVGDFTMVCQSLRSLSNGEVRLEPARIELTRNFMLHARTQIDESLNELNKMVESLRKQADLQSLTKQVE